MNFLEAHRLVRQFAGGPTRRLLLGTSATADPLMIFMRAAAAMRGWHAEVRVPPFNTLPQALLQPPVANEKEVFLLLPWDLVPEADWRSGVPDRALDERALRAHAADVLARIVARHPAGILYVDAPVVPLFANARHSASLAAWLVASARAAGAHVLPARSFSLANYFTSGVPFASDSLGDVAEAIVAAADDTPSQPRKVLVSDLDNVMWHGVIGEDGLSGIEYGSHGAGFRHFVYQSFLAKLEREGAILAAVSRNDSELALSPFRAGGMTLGEKDFVAIVASYNAKSAQIQVLAQQLNLGLDSFVFVDDNPIELEEVSRAIPGITVVAFPSSDDGMPAFLDELAALFSRDTVTQEDAARTEMYRRRLEGIAPSEVTGADLTAFLRSLDMSLVITDRSTGDRERAVQLINKTNQFNLNGRRWTDDEVGETLARGGKLYTASLTDRTGSHGEIVAILIDDQRVARAFVMSCRVFQRRVEHAVLAWLANQGHGPVALDFEETARNEPTRQFLVDPAFTRSDDGARPSVAVNLQAFRAAHADDMALFKLQTPG